MNEVIVEVLGMIGGDVADTVISYDCSIRSCLFVGSQDVSIELKKHSRWDTIGQKVHQIISSLITSL